MSDSCFESVERGIHFFTFSYLVYGEFIRGGLYVGSLQPRGRHGTHRVARVQPVNDMPLCQQIMIWITLNFTAIL
jgi:hypothetical protein